MSPVPPVAIEGDPERLINTCPSGLAISRDGTLALVANAESKSVTVLRILGRAVRPVAEVPLGDSVLAVAIAPDGSRA